jgi:hypothetical protein
LPQSRAKWKWKSASNTNDPGLSNKNGSFNASEWSETEKKENPLRRGFIRASAKQACIDSCRQHTLFSHRDTWFGLSASRYKWYDDDQVRPMGPNAGFKDFVRLRKSQGFNWINIIAGISQLENRLISRGSFEWMTVRVQP